MIYIQYAFLVPLSLVFTLIGIIFAPVMVLFATEQYGWLDNQAKTGYGYRLPECLNIFMTPDNSLEGDATFERLNPPSYWSRVKWLWRNPAYSFAIKYLTLPIEKKYYGYNEIKDNDQAKKGWLFVLAGGLFQFVWIIPIGFKRCFMINAGWNIRALVDPNANPINPYQATFVFSPRISGFR